MTNDSEPLPSLVAAARHANTSGGFVTTETELSPEEPALDQPATTVRASLAMTAVIADGALATVVEPAEVTDTVAWGPVAGDERTALVARLGTHEPAVGAMEELTLLVTAWLTPDAAQQVAEMLRHQARTRIDAAGGTQWPDEISSYDEVDTEAVTGAAQGDWGQFPVDTTAGTVSVSTEPTSTDELPPIFLGVEGEAVEQQSGYVGISGHLLPKEAKRLAEAITDVVTEEL